MFEHTCRCALVALFLALSCGVTPALAAPRTVAGEYLVIFNVPSEAGLPVMEMVKTRRSQMGQMLSELQLPEEKVLRRYRHMPMIALQKQTAADMESLRQDPRVRAVYPNHLLYPHLSESLPLINQPLPAQLGFGGQGAAVVIIDTGLDYTRTDFGSCTAPGDPAECRVKYAGDIAPDDGSRDDSGHGTNVGAIVASVADQADLIALDVFDGNTATLFDVLDAIYWAIDNQATYNIAVINLSLGDSSRFASPCDDWKTNPYLDAVEHAREAGIVVIASAGNEGYSDGMGQPACTLGAVSVGAVYDAAVGGVSYSSCTDVSTAADQVACFSNSADYMTLWAPGSLITAGGALMAGTSQAAPHVAGVAAVLRATFPQESVDQAVARLTDSTAHVTDSRNGVTLPRLDEQQALGVTDFAVVPGAGRWAVFSTALGLIILVKNFA